MIKNRLNDNKKSLLSSLFERSDFFISVPTFIFPCPRKKMRGQGEKYTQAGKWFYDSNKVGFLSVIVWNL